jgi:hypothetical protein
MITTDGNWIMEGLDHDDVNRIKSSKELSDYINDIGFLPLFKNKIPGFSVEELTARNSWWSGDEEDPWDWRAVIAAEGEIAYGKLFFNRAGFVSKQWYPVFAAYRRDGYDFDSRYEDGMASYRAKKLMDILMEYDTIPSYRLKELAGFGKEGEKGFEGVLTTLQMQTYITVRDFKRKINKKGDEYGWPVAVFSLSEKLFGEDYIRSAYHLKTSDAKDCIIKHLLEKYPQARREDVDKCIR